MTAQFLAPPERPGVNKGDWVFLATIAHEFCELVDPAREIGWVVSVRGNHAQVQWPGRLGPSRHRVDVLRKVPRTVDKIELDYFLYSRQARGFAIARKPDDPDRFADLRSTTLGRPWVIYDFQQLAYLSEAGGPLRFGSVRAAIRHLDRLSLTHYPEEPR